MWIRHALWGCASNSTRGLCEYCPTFLSRTRSMRWLDMQLYNGRRNCKFTVHGIHSMARPITYTAFACQKLSLLETCAHEEAWETTWIYLFGHCTRCPTDVTSMMRTPLEEFLMPRSKISSEAISHMHWTSDQSIRSTLKSPTSLTAVCQSNTVFLALWSRTQITC